MFHRLTRAVDGITRERSNPVQHRATPRGSKQLLAGKGGERRQERRGGGGGNRKGCPSESSADPVDLTAALTDKLKT